MNIQIFFISIICIIYQSAFADDSIKTFEGHQNGVTSIAISNNLLVSASKDQTVKVWDINAGTELRTCYGHNKEVTSISFSPDGNQAISGDLDGTIILWDINTCQIVHNFYNESEVKSVAWSPNNAYILSGHDNNAVKLWDINTKQELRTFTGHTDQVTDVSFSPNSTVLSASKDKTIKLWNLATGKEIRTFTGHTGRVVSAAFSADGLFVISSSWDNTIRRWNIKTGEHVLHSDQTRILDVNFLLNSNYALSGGEDQTLKVWNLNSAKNVFCSLKGHTDTITSVAASKDGKVLISASSDKTLKQWQICKIPPIAEFSYFTKSMKVAVDASESKAINGDIIKYQWESSNGQTSSGAKASFSYQTVGTNIITLTVTDNHGMSSKLQKQVDVHPAQLGKAIIIAGGGAQDSNGLFRYSNKYVQSMYRLVKQRGLKDSDVYYLNPRAPDLDGDGYQEANLHDYDLREAQVDIEKAFKQAANNLQAGQEFIFYIHGHANQDQFNITKNYKLQASKFRKLLDLIPAGVRQQIFIDTCYSGSFLDELAGAKNRTVITSTDDKSLTWQVTYYSFAEAFLTQLQKGETVVRAFKYAKKFIAENPKSFSQQTPWLDANSDGISSDDDFIIAEKQYLINPKINENKLPELEVNSRIVLKDQQRSATIWAKLTNFSHDKIRKVQAILIKPNLVTTRYKYNAAQNRYEIVYDRFWTKGTWKILYQAQDNDGFWSEIETAEIEQTSDNLTDIKIDIELNKPNYKVSDDIHWNISVNAQNKILYLGIILPNGSVVAINSNGEFNQQIQPYQQIKLIGQQNIFINTPIPKNSPLDKYSACGVLIPTGETFQMDGSNWESVHCTNFNIG
jgi:WD40 repeat protein